MPSDPAENGAVLDGLPLPRLLLLARLTPGQALVIAADLVAALRTSHSAGQAYQGFQPTAVSVGADGSTRLVVQASARLTEDTSQADLAATRAVLAELAEATAPYAGNGRGSAGSAPVDQPASADPHPALALAISGLADPDQLPDVAARLNEASSAADSTARRELARIVDSAKGLGLWPSVDASDRNDLPTVLEGLTTPGTAQQVAGGDLSVNFGVTRPDSGTRVSATGRWAVAVAVLLAVLVVELTVLRGRIAQDIELLLDAGRAADAATGREPPAPAVLPPAPTSAGIVTGVDVRALGRCVPGAPCEVRVLIRLAPDGSSHRVRWTFRAVERCTGWAGELPGGELAVEPGGRAAAAVVTVPLPAGQALAVMALTDAPAIAASQPLLVPTPGSC